MLSLFAKAFICNFRLLCENMNSKPIVIMFCLEYVVKEKIILKSMQAKERQFERVCVCVCVYVWCVCVCVCERERERERESNNIRFIKAYCMQFSVGRNRCKTHNSLYAWLYAWVCV